MSNVPEKVVCKCKIGADCVCFHSGTGPVHLTGSVYQGKCFFLNEIS
mgnify:FL=1